MKNINSPSLFPSGTEAYGINNPGEVVGTGYLSPSNFHAFLYSGGKMKDLGPSKAFQATAYAIKTSGQIVGTYSLNSGGSGTFLYTRGKMTTLPNPASSRGVLESPSTTLGKLWAPCIPGVREGVTRLSSAMVPGPT